MRDERERSKDVFQKLTIMDGDPTKFGRSTFNNEQKSTFSKTGNSALWARNKS